jgi:hypothetical protein
MPGGPLDADGVGDHLHLTLGHSLDDPERIDGLSAQADGLGVRYAALPRLLNPAGFIAKWIETVGIGSLLMTLNETDGASAWPANTGRAHFQGAAPVRWEASR